MPALVVRAAEWNDRTEETCYAAGLTQMGRSMWAATARPLLIQGRAGASLRRISSYGPFSGLDATGIVKQSGEMKTEATVFRLHTLSTKTCDAHLPSIS